MAEAVFLVDIAAAPTQVHEALTTKVGLVSWWTDDVQIEDGALSLGFLDAPKRFTLRVDSESESRVQWTSVGEFPPHWAGTEVIWNLMDNPDADGSRVFFEHKGFPAPDPMLGHTAMTWANLMNSLRSYCETGSPSPMLTGSPQRPS